MKMKEILHNQSRSARILWCQTYNRGSTLFVLYQITTIMIRLIKFNTIIKARMLFWIQRDRKMQMLTILMMRRLGLTSRIIFHTVTNFKATTICFKKKLLLSEVQKLPKEAQFPEGSKTRIP